MVINKTEANDFYLGQEKINFTESYKYLGLTLSSDVKFVFVIEELIKKGLKSYFKICKTLAINSIKQSTFMTIFDKMVKPIILYGAEV